MPGLKVMSGVTRQVRGTSAGGGGLSAAGAGGGGAGAGVAWAIVVGCGAAPTGGVGAVAFSALSASISRCMSASFRSTSPEPPRDVQPEMAIIPARSAVSVDLEIVMLGLREVGSPEERIGDDRLRIFPGSVQRRGNGRPMRSAPD